LAKLFLLGHRRVASSIQISTQLPEGAGPWKLLWESPELPHRQIAQMREIVARQWGRMETSPGVFLADHSEVRAALEAFVSTHLSLGTDGGGWPSWYSQKRIPDPGFVYVLTNSSMPGLVKIGRTSRPVRDRVRELGTTGVPSPFEVHWVSGLLANHSEAERELHSALDMHRVTDDREFFRVDPAEVVEYCEAVARDFIPSLHPRDVLTDFFEWLQETAGLSRLPESAVVTFIAKLIDAHETPEHLKEGLAFFLKQLQEAGEDDGA